MTAYYNEYDPGAAAWLRELIKNSLIADGEVDERSILDVTADDLKGFTQCHFFAGIGGWSYALRLVGWPDDQPVWTGSPPCQPFSTAGQRKGKDDERHLAPHFASLVASGRPPILFGEQVASAAVFGKAARKTRSQSEGEPEWAWIDDLQDRLEAAHYAVGASDIPAAGVGAPHIRQRTFFGAIRLADTSIIRQSGQREMGRSSDSTSCPDREKHRVVNDGRSERLADAGSPQSEATWIPSGVQSQDNTTWRIVSHNGLDGDKQGDRNHCGQEPKRPRSLDGFWRDADWLFCRDGKWRPVEPGTFPLAHGIPARVGRLRGYGNAIVPQAAAQFVRAFLDATP
jgi:DNA (cytosine-5)-methyltransferase 1